MFMCLRKHGMSPFTATVRRDLMYVILDTPFTNLPRDFSTKIDLLLQSHRSIGHFDSGKLKTCWNSFY